MHSICHWAVQETLPFCFSVWKIQRKVDLGERLKTCQGCGRKRHTKQSPERSQKRWCNVGTPLLCTVLLPSKAYLGPPGNWIAVVKGMWEVRPQRSLMIIWNLVIKYWDKSTKCKRLNYSCSQYIGLEPFPFFWVSSSHMSPFLIVFFFTSFVTLIWVKSCCLSLRGIPVDFSSAAFPVRFG